MVLLDLFISYGPWAWFVTGLVLLALELVVPGGYFLWLGTAGILTGLCLYGPVTWPWQVTIFGVLAIAIVVGWTLITAQPRGQERQPVSQSARRSLHRARGGHRRADQGRLRAPCPRRRRLAHQLGRIWPPARRCASSVPMDRC